jgi:hypothetical protein
MTDNAHKYTIYSDRLVPETMQTNMPSTVTDKAYKSRIYGDWAKAHKYFIYSDR